MTLVSAMTVDDLIPRGGIRSLIQSTTTPGSSYSDYVRPTDKPPLKPPMFRTTRQLVWAVRSIPPPNAVNSFAPSTIAGSADADAEVELAADSMVRKESSSRLRIPIAFLRLFIFVPSHCVPRRDIDWVCALCKSVRLR